MSTRITSRNALVASNEEERITDTLVLDAFYTCGEGADVQTIYEMVNFDHDGTRLMDDSCEEAELITHDRIEVALARAANRASSYQTSLQAFHSGQSEIGLVEPKTFLYRDKDVHGEGFQYSLVVPNGTDQVNIQLSEAEAMQIAGDWIEHYMIGAPVEAA